MELHTSIRKQTKARLALEGPAGSGKTYSALLLAYGLCRDWSKIALIDTEQDSASLYSHLGPFSSVGLGAPYHPTRFYDAIDLCDTSGKEVIIVDSLSLEWIGDSGMADQLSGKHYQDALKAHRAMLCALRNTEAHIICTLRTKRKLVHAKQEGKWRLLMAEIPLQQEGIEYIFDTVLRLDHQHLAHVIKDRTGMFSNKPAAPITTEMGQLLLSWCMDGELEVPDDLQIKIDNCTSVSELHLLLSKEDVDVELIQAFTRRRLELEGIETPQLHSLKGGLL